MHALVHALADIFFPRLCPACGRNLLRHERMLCQPCQFRLPRTAFHDMVGNPLEQLFAGRYQAGAVTSFLFFTKSGMVQRSLHQLKYNGAKELGHYLGFNFGEELRTSYRFREVELVAPVPLHWEKLRLRGYNQSEWIAKGVGEAMGIQVVPNLLERVKATATQTRKGRLERWENVAEAFAASKQLKSGARVLLVDDVLTTGATLEACARALDAVTGRPSYLATLACAVR